jgi:hypothetical protein
MNVLDATGAAVGIISTKANETSVVLHRDVNS